MLPQGPEQDWTEYDNYIGFTNYLTHTIHYIIMSTGQIHLFCFRFVLQLLILMRQKVRINKNRCKLSQIYCIHTQNSDVYCCAEIL